MVVPAANALKISVGTAAVGRVIVSANPTLIPAYGGTSVISATVSDINGNALAFAPVAFSTTAGVIDPPARYDRLERSGDHFESPDVDDGDGDGERRRDGRRLGRGDDNADPADESDESGGTDGADDSDADR